MIKKITIEYEIETEGEFCSRCCNYRYRDRCTLFKSELEWNRNEGDYERYEDCLKATGDLT